MFPAKHAKSKGWHNQMFGNLNKKTNGYMRIWGEGPQRRYQASSGLAFFQKEMFGKFFFKSGPR